MNEENEFDDPICSVTDDGEVEQFEVRLFGDADVAGVVEYVPFCKGWVEARSIQILNRSSVDRAFAERGEVGLVLLFISSTFYKCIRQWTTEVLRKPRKIGGLLHHNDLMAYVGLEIAS